MRRHLGKQLLHDSIHAFRHKRRRCFRVCGSLADVTPGCRACIQGFDPGIPQNRQDHLMAYGLIPGHWVEVLQHSPVTVVKVDNTELALEDKLASQIKVE